MRAVFLGMVLPLTAAAQLPPDLTLESFASGFSGITAIRGPHDGSGRVFVLEQGGTIRIVLADGTVLPAPFFRLCASAGPGCFVPPGGFSGASGERGLLGLAFHPLYAANRRLFINYTDGAGHTVIARLQAQAGNPDLADPASFAILLRIEQDFSNHNGGDLAFGPDGYLYIAMGDGGSAGDPCSRAQTLRPADLVTGGSCGSHLSRTLLGKMLRIDVDASTPAGLNTLCGAAPDGSAPYGIPPGNPFPSPDPQGRCAEIWAWGLRNPWRFSFDRATGELWIADVGQNTREEVNLEPANAPGRNYGWRCREGTHVFNTSAPFCNDPGNIASFVPPVIEYNRTSPRCSVTGGYRYRGPAFNLRGFYFFGDYCEGRVLVAAPGPSGWSFVTWSASSIGNIRTFGEDEAGRLYVGTNNTVFRITGDLTVIFRDGFEG